MIVHGRWDQDRRREALKYIPVGCVAILEGYFRLAITDLVNHGAPFRENSLKLEDYKVDFRTLVSLSEKKVTAGELMSHVISFSSMEDINRHLSVVLDTDFLKAMSEYQHPDLDEPLGDSFLGLLMPDLQRVFTTRHIVCHELAPRLEVKVKDVRNWVSSLLLFSFHSEFYIGSLIGDRRARRHYTVRED